MSKYAVYVGKNSENSSMYLVGSQLASFLGGCPIARKPEDLKGVDTVICIVVEDLSRLSESRRFTGYGRLVAFFAANAQEYPHHDLVKIFVMSLTGVVDKLVVHSKHTYEALATLKRQYLSPKQYALYDKKVLVSLWGVEDRFKFNLEGRSHLQFIAPFNRLNQSYKRLKEHADISLYLKVKNASIDHLYISGGLPEPKDAPDVYTVVKQGTRDDYVNTIKTVGVSICTSSSESFGIYYLELIASGVVVLFLREGWVEKLLPSYPHIFSGQMALTVAAATASTEEGFSAYQAALAEYVTTDEFKQFSMSLAKTRFLEVLEK